MAVFLNQARVKVLALRRGGSSDIEITHFCVGTHAFYNPSETQTDLLGRINIGANNKKAIESITYDSTNMQNVITCKLTELECVGANITELGLIDAEGDVVCIKTFTAKEKTNEREMVFTVKDKLEVS